jgi:hypothetical protein
MMKIKLCYQYSGTLSLYCDFYVHPSELHLLDYVIVYRGGNIYACFARMQICCVS